MGWFGPAKTEEQKKREMIRRYFEPDKGPATWMFAAAGLTLALVSLALSYFGVSFYAPLAAAILAVVMFAIAWVIFNERSQRADDDDIDIWRDQDFKAVIKRISDDAALAASDLMDRRHPIVFTGLPRFENLQIHRNYDDGKVRRRWRFKVKVGRDGITRFTPPCLTVLHFTKDHLLAYQCDLDLLSGKVLNETLDEYFWQDIVSLQIERQTLPTEADDRQLYEQWSETMPNDQSERYEAVLAEQPAVLATGQTTILRLKTTSGGGLEIVLADERFVANPPPDCLQTRNDDAIARLRKLLRDRKARR
jgi:hypothetical protein